MGLWQRLFASRGQMRSERKREPSLRQPAVATEPKSPPPGSPAAWAEALKAKKDYSALAGVTHEAFSDQWWPKVRLAQRILTQAGAEAVPAILEEIGSRGRCDSQLADVLVDIGDPRAVPLLKQALIRRSSRMSQAHKAISKGSWLSSMEGSKKNRSLQRPKRRPLHTLA